MRIEFLLPVSLYKLVLSYHLLVIGSCMHLLLNSDIQSPSLSEVHNIVTQVSNNTYHAAVSNKFVDYVITLQIRFKKCSFPMLLCKRQTHLRWRNTSQLHTIRRLKKEMQVKGAQKEWTLFMRHISTRSSAYHLLTLTISVVVYILACTKYKSVLQFLYLFVFKCINLLILIASQSSIFNKFITEQYLLMFIFHAIAVAVPTLYHYFTYFVIYTSTHLHVGWHDKGVAILSSSKITTLFSSNVP